MDRSSHYEVLLIEDNPEHVTLLSYFLEEVTSPKIHLHIAGTLEEGLATLQVKQCDAVLADLGLPDSDGLETLVRLLQAHPTLPVIVLTARDDPEYGLKAVQEGAQDFLVKGRIGGDLVARAITYAIERKTIQQRLQESRDELTAVNAELLEQRSTALSIAEDALHARRRAEESKAALEEKTRALERVNAELDQFAYIVSHDLKAPIRHIRFTVEELYDQYPQERDREESYLKRLLTLAERMEVLIDDLLQYSRLQFEGEQTEVDLNQLVEEVIAEYTGEIDEAGAKITLSTLPRVYGYRTALRQLFQNLISNALKFRGNAPPEIDISSTLDDEYWRFAVKDNGVGIEPHYHKTVFLPFKRAASATSVEGTGIGLAICSKVVNAHGGKIWLSSERGAGTTFHFTFPKSLEARQP